MNIIGFGECMLEISGTPLALRFGGDTLNTCLYLARLGPRHGHRVAYATALGDDELSAGLLRAWREEGIDCRWVERRSGGTPGLYLVTTGPDGERHFHYWRANSPVRGYFAGPDTPLEQSLARDHWDAFYLSGISLAILPPAGRERLLACARQARERGMAVIFDNNYRPRLWPAGEARHWHDRLAPLVTLALLTEEDEQALYPAETTDALLARWQGAGCRELVLKRGAAPCLIALDEARFSQAPAPVDSVLDTCAAGDSFAAGYLAARLAGEAPAVAARLGHEMAGIVIQHPGAIAPRDAMLSLL
ncbi:sugar kinase [Zobellella iuensis]|uniref:Sugar kinase n=1 Tax=Zobellella iuensis TaxID=2803811 RepID=A0ABS1QLV6_9GAMM|nr:sugar kinase [Zobellella iuensis]MBL1375830.1 sugar kinase [Zobellella iuensis]